MQKPFLAQRPASCINYTKRKITGLILPIKHAAHNLKLTNMS